MEEALKNASQDPENYRELLGAGEGSPITRQLFKVLVSLGNRGGFTVDEFCRWLPMGRTKFYSEVRTGRIKLRKVGTKSIVTFPDAVEYRDNLPCLNEEEA